MGRQVGGDAGGGKKGSNVTYQRQIPKFLRQFYASQGELPAAQSAEGEDGGAVAAAEDGDDTTGAEAKAGDERNPEEEERDEIADLQEEGFAVVELAGTEETRKRRRAKETKPVFGTLKKDRKDRKETQDKKAGEPVKTQNKSLLSFNDEDDDEEDSDF
uniref:DUF4604 domain-containing protein n=1 Tax=Rhodosorus marinus TaxID=101924 RepID=A0A7S3EG74_9RHOD|mmetsp:Transcript_30339/g.116368  ORF Transcript_30339/g.116368 Transcript_30339/m.116368 type:complete len:159 (+) Transcript_30339:577-1053(+)|eukprot:CAMPEP_0113960474 /NCGR_PEP_ID=MMETSP0011_2-20120614/4731_1 /TAXON_ID=101924 /ORGANISM="Rhodosorus marinus" /LENGTH=158 /DNA_ID=CAMNT_0000971923 /DNA_START=340 /DNA_END=816 /DNA_ORIENTATION=+ /assembly_acc=CAM_ASM_000156